MGLGSGNLAMGLVDSTWEVREERGRGRFPLPSSSPPPLYCEKQFAPVCASAAAYRRRLPPLPPQARHGMVNTRHGKAEEPEPGSSTRSGKRPKKPSPETSPELALLAHHMISTSTTSPLAGTSHGVVYTPQLYDGIAASSCTPMYDTALLQPDAMMSNVTPTVTTIPDLVRLCVTGLPDALPRIGELEASFLAGGREDGHESKA